MNRTHQFYSRPSYIGAGFPVYSGSWRQRGGSIFGATKTDVLPDTATVKRALDRQAEEYMNDVSQDVMNGESVREAMKDRANEYSAKILSKGLNSISGMANRAIAGNQRRRHRRPVSHRRPTASRKRPATSSLSGPVKRRRVLATRRRRRVAVRRRIPPRRRMPKRMPRMPKRMPKMRFGRRGLF